MWLFGAWMGSEMNERGGFNNFVLGRWYGGGRVRRKDGMNSVWEDVIAVRAYQGVPLRNLRRSSLTVRGGRFVAGLDVYAPGCV
jgi:hypothetical protein